MLWEVKVVKGYPFAAIIMWRNTQHQLLFMVDVMLAMLDVDDVKT